MLPGLECRYAHFNSGLEDDDDELDKLADDMPEL